MSRPLEVKAVCVLACLLIVLGTGVSVGDSTYAPGELIVSFVDQETTVLQSTEEGTSSIYEFLNDIFESYGLLETKPLFRPTSLVKNVFLFRFPAETNLDDVAGDIGALEMVKEVSKNWSIDESALDYIPCDYAIQPEVAWPDIGRQDLWTYYFMQVDRAWDVTKGDSSVVVAVLDTGIDWEHPDLEENMWINPEEDINQNGRYDNYPAAQGGDLNGQDDDSPTNGFVDDVIGWDFNCRAPCVDPWNPTHKAPSYFAHGTAMSSIISAVTDNGCDSLGENKWGVAGIGFRARLMAVRCAEYYLSDILNGTQYAIDNGADIVNMTLNRPGFSGDSVS